ncbi:hypothetical protein ACB098_09G144700 [Castanea mollissima]
MAIAIDQHHGFKPFSRSQICRLQSYTHLDHKILEQSNLPHTSMQAFEVDNIHRSLSTPCLSITTEVEEEFDKNPKIEIVGGQEDPRARALVLEVAVALASGVDPMPVSSGLGGAYFLCSRNNGDNIAVAKPIDEEPLALNNPKGFGGRMLGQPGLKRSVRIGETGIRELAAYLLDHNSFAGVPPTALVKISHVAFHVNNEATVLAEQYKVASLQRFVEHEYDAGELGSSGFSVASVHSIGIFDVRLMNLDRHAGNILVKKHKNDTNYAPGVAELVPIDHGLCLPEFLDDPYFEWLHWPQASVPFSKYEIEYISNLDPFKDAELLRTQLPSIRESSIRVLVLCTIFLKQAAASGLCLADIGAMMTREFCGGEEKLSVLENLCTQAKSSLPSICYHDQEKEFEIFQLEDENEESLIEVLDLPQLLKSHPGVVDPLKMMPSFSTINDNFDDNDGIGAYDGSEDNNFCDNHKVAGHFMKSMSFSGTSYNFENGGISFEDMSEDEWELFLQIFEELLPKLFEGKDQCTNSKQRLGTSCKF